MARTKQNGNPTSKAATTHQSALAVVDLSTAKKVPAEASAIDSSKVPESRSRAALNAICDFGWPPCKEDLENEYKDRAKRQELLKNIPSPVVRMAYFSKMSKEHQLICFFPLGYKLEDLARAAGTKELDFSRIVHYPKNFDEKLQYAENEVYRALEDIGPKDCYLRDFVSKLRDCMPLLAASYLTSSSSKGEHKLHFCPCCKAMAPWRNYHQIYIPADQVCKKNNPFTRKSLEQHFMGVEDAFHSAVDLFLSGLSREHPQPPRAPLPHCAHSKEPTQPPRDPQPPRVAQPPRAHSLGSRHGVPPRRAGYQDDMARDYDRRSGDQDSSRGYNRRAGYQEDMARDYDGRSGYKDDLSLGYQDDMARDYDRRSGYKDDLSLGYQDSNRVDDYSRYSKRDRQEYQGYRHPDMARDYDRRAGYQDDMARDYDCRAGDQDSSRGYNRRAGYQDDMARDYDRRSGYNDDLSLGYQDNMARDYNRRGRVDDYLRYSKRDKQEYEGDRHSAYDAARMAQFQLLPAMLPPASVTWSEEPDIDMFISNFPSFIVKTRTFDSDVSRQLVRPRAGYIPLSERKQSELEYSCVPFLPTSSSGHYKYNPLFAFRHGSWEGYGTKETIPQPSEKDMRHPCQYNRLNFNQLVMLARSGMSADTVRFIFHHRCSKCKNFFGEYPEARKLQPICVKKLGEEAMKTSEEPTSVDQMGETALLQLQKGTPGGQRNRRRNKAALKNDM